MRRPFSLCSFGAIVKLLKNSKAQNLFLLKAWIRNRYQRQRIFLNISVNSLCFSCFMKWQISQQQFGWAQILQRIFSSAYGTSYLESRLPFLPHGLSCHIKVKQAGVLLTVKKHRWNIPLFLTTFLFLLIVNYFVRSASVCVGYCWSGSQQAILSVSGRMFGEEQMFPNRLIQKPSSVTPLLVVGPVIWLAR